VGHARDPNRNLPRIDAACGGALDIEHLEALEDRLEVGVTPRSAEHLTISLYSVQTLAFVETLATLRNFGLHITGEIHIPIRKPDGQNVHLYRYEIEDSRIGSPPWWRGCPTRRRPRALNEERAPTAPSTPSF
jgi:hypothetical protein